MHRPDLVPGYPPEAVHVLKDPESGLNGVIVLHSTRLGPAAGGCRLWTYKDEGSAATDALRLAEGMAYKNAIAELPLGGGKAVINVPKGPFDRRALFAAFGREVAKLKGSYVTAEDVGTSVSDMEVVREHCSFVAGLERVEGRPSGDPSPWTALGVFVSMQEAVRRQFGTDLKGLTVAVQGLGQVGSALCQLLHAAGAKLIVAETRPGIAAEIGCQYGAFVMNPTEVVNASCDVFAPCALGAVLNEQTVPRLKAGVVCGAANNVLATDADGLVLAEREILYCPDYVVNAGGIINVCAEYLGWSIEDVELRVRATGDRLGAVLDYAAENNMTSHRAADEIARERIAGNPAAKAAAA